MKKGNKCKVDYCDRYTTRKDGYCNKHHQQMVKHGKINKETERKAIDKNAKCSIDGCTEKVYAKNLCYYHYIKKNKEDKKNKSTCNEEGCDKGVYAKGFCYKHYLKFLSLEKEKEEVNIENKCIIEGCNRSKYYKQDYCIEHFKELKKCGDIIMDKVCSVEGCNKRHKAKGYCNYHYQQFRKYGQVIKIKPKRINSKPKKVKKAEICKENGCNNYARTKGYCPKHYKQILKYKRTLTDEEYYKVIHVRCIKEGCNNRVYKMGYCKEHYNNYCGEGVIMKDIENDNINNKNTVEEDIIICDKCGNQTSNKSIIDFKPFGDADDTITMNLCHKCSNDLIKWMLKKNMVKSTN